jgi:hypothetical protein
VQRHFTTKHPDSFTNKKGIRFRNLGFFGYPRHWITSIGTVWTSDASIDGGYVWERKKTYISHSTGYMCVSFWKDGKAHPYAVHRLVLLAFVGPPPEDKPQCRHLDGNRANPVLENLCWGSQLDNEQDKRDHGTSTKKTKEERNEINRLWATGRYQQRELARMFGVTQGTIWNIIHKVMITYRQQD